MSSEQAAKRLQPEALDAFLDGILAELANPSDPIALDEIRAAFRKRVPLSKRSYAAAALILRAAGLSRGTSRTAPRETPPKREDRRVPKEKKAETRARDRKPKEPEDDAGSSRQQRPRFVGEATTLFFSMGKRHRFYPRVLIDLVVQTAKLQPEAIGEVRSFDNYSFADFDPAKAGEVIAKLDGYEFRGRKLSVGPAKKRDELMGDASAS